MAKQEPALKNFNLPDPSGRLIHFKDAVPGITIGTFAKRSATVPSS